MNSDKHTYKYSADEKAAFKRAAKEFGDKPECTKFLMDKFGLPQTAAHYYRSVAFGYRDGRKLPVKIALNRDVYVQLVNVTKRGKFKDHSATIQDLINQADNV